jgi:hypothetical protein
MTSKTLAEASDDFSLAIGEVRALSGGAAREMSEMGYGAGFAEQDGHEFGSAIIAEFESELADILDIIRRERDAEQDRKRRSVERLEVLTAKVRAALQGEEVEP